MTDNNEQVELLVSDPDLMDAIRYLELRQYNPDFGGIPPMDWCAEQMGLGTRQTLYRRINKWTENGALEKARRMLFVPKAQATLEAIDIIVEAIPDIILRQIKIAKESESDFASTSAAKFLIEALAIPSINRMMTSPSNSEAEYLNTPKSFSADV